MAKIQIVVRAASGCDYFRCTLPAIYLQKDSEWSQENPIEMLWIGQDEWRLDCDILMYNRFILTPVLVLQEMQKKGMKIIVDIDDYWVLPATHVNKDWTEEGCDKTTLEHIKIADLVVCTSIRLQEEVRKYNKNTVVIPNALPFGEGLFQPGEKTESEKTRFLYAGGVTHLPDIELLRGKFKKVASEPFIKNNAEFIIAGYNKAKAKKYHTERDRKEKNNNFTLVEYQGPYDVMVNIFAVTQSYKVIDTAPVSKYITCYDEADVVLAPLVESKWNSFKSTLKILEAASRRIPIICSNVAPYKDLRPVDGGIFFIEHPDDWLKYFRKCIKEKQWVKEQGELLANWVETEFSLRKWNQVRKELFKNLLK